MHITYEFISEHGIDESYNLDVCSSDVNHISVLQWQCKAKMIYTDAESVQVYEADNPYYNVKAKKFIELAKSTRASLALTPEYSFPWTVLDDIIDNSESWPNEKNLWCLGMQGISNIELKYKIEQWQNQNDKIELVSNFTFDTNKAYTDALIYLFFNINREKLVIIIQPKSIPCRDPLINGEAEGLNCGNIHYIFDTGPNLFMSVICSDIFAENRPWVELENKIVRAPIIVYFAQLEQNQKSPQLVKKINELTDLSNTRVIQLNWATGSSLHHENGNRVYGDKRSGSRLIKKDTHKAIEFWNNEDKRKLIEMNLKNGVLLAHNYKKYYWMFPKEEHLLYYKLDQYNDIQACEAVEPNNFPLFKEKYVYSEENWIIANQCSLDLKEIIGDVSQNIKNVLMRCDRLGCSECSKEVCKMTLVDRFIAICSGEQEENESANHYNANTSLSCINNTALDINDERKNKIKKIKIIENQLRQYERLPKKIRYIAPFLKFEISDATRKSKETYYNLEDNDQKKYLSIFIDSNEEAAIKLCNKFLREENVTANLKSNGILIFYSDVEGYKLCTSFKDEPNIGVFSASGVKPTTGKGIRNAR